MSTSVLGLEDNDGPLDFEAEDQLLNSTPVPTAKKRRKIIGLDDLLTDHYKEQGKLLKKASKRRTVLKRCNSDEDDEEVKLFKLVDECHKQVNEIRAEDEINVWGLQVFGPQKSPPSLECRGLGTCGLLQSFMNSEHNSVLGLDSDNGKVFLEGLLTNGWLTKLVFTCGRVEKIIASWTFNLMLYSNNGDLQTSACDFWTSILAFENQAGKSLCVEWLPSFKELQSALEAYGYLQDVFTNVSSLSKTDCTVECPQLNIKSWIKVVAVCCMCRHAHAILSTSEVEHFLCVFLYLFLDRRLLGLSLLLHECLGSVLSFFTDDEWRTSSTKVAVSITSRIPKDMNCLRIVECLYSNNTRSKHLRSQLAYQILVNCFETKVTSAEDVLRLLVSINVKDKGCDFFKIYIYLVLAENWLFSSSLLEERPLIREMWGLYLRNCSCQITSTDWRSHALKVRNKASYLLQTTVG